MTTNIKNQSKEILRSIDDMVASFLYYDRRDDEDLPEGAIEANLREGNIFLRDIASRFEKELRRQLNEGKEKNEK